MEIEALPVEMTPSVAIDSYYPGLSNVTAQIAPTVVSNRAWSAVGIAQGGTTDINFNPSHGVSHVILSATLPSTANVTWAGWAMPQGWLYAMMARVSLRVAGSAVMTWSGEQLLLDSFSDCEEGFKASSLLQLGGAFLGKNGVADFAPGNANLSASAFIKLPWTTVSALQRGVPLDTGLLTAPITVSITWKNFADVAFNYSASAANVGALPVAFASASMNFSEVQLVRSEDALNARHDMNTEMIMYPLRYLAIPATRSATIAVTDSSVQTVALTGLARGSLLYTDLWFSQAGNVASGNPFNYVTPLSLRILMNGTVLYDSGIGGALAVSNSQLLSLCQRKCPTAVAASLLSATAGNGGATATPQNINWTVVPYSQVSEPGAGRQELRSGLPISNVTLTCEVAFQTTGNYVVNCAHHYAGAMAITRGNASFIT